MGLQKTLGCDDRLNESWHGNNTKQKDNKKIQFNESVALLVSVFLPKLAFFTIFKLTFHNSKAKLIGKNFK